MASSERRYTKTVREANPVDDGLDGDLDQTEVGDVDADVVAVSDDDAAADNDQSDDGYQHRISLHEEELAQRRKSAIEAGRRKGGAVGAAMAGAMLAVQEILEKPKEEAPVVVEANSKPEDLDSDGITVELDGTNYHTPPLERIEQERKTGTL